MLIVFGLSHGDDLPSKIEVENSINRTINEVEKLIRENSTLPHLTRNEIVEILSNVTSKNLETLENKETIEKARKLYERALMVVLPYNAKDAKDNIKELYTKPPIVQIITDTSNSKEFNVWKNEKFLYTPTPTQKMQRGAEPLENLVVTHASEKENPSASKTQYKNHRETYSEMRKTPLKETLKFESAPMKFSFNLDNLQKQPAINEAPPTTTKRPVFQGESSSTKNEELYVIYSTSATKIQPIETSPKKEDSLVNLKESQTTSRPLNNKNVLSLDQWRYNAPTSTTESPTTPVKSLDSSSKISLEEIVVPTVISETEDPPEITKMPLEKIQVTEQSTFVYVTPTLSSPSSFPEKLKYNSTYNLNSGGFRDITTTTMRSEVMELLASIGLRPENSSNVEEVFKKSQESLSLKNKSEISNSNGIVYPAISGLSAVVPDSPSITVQNTFENPVLEIGKGMNNLTPDVQLLFQRFGLDTSNLITTTSTPRSIVNTNSYTNFKPLPTSKVKNEDMKEFLAQFGLGISDNRQKKAMPVSTERPSLIEVVPSNMRQILENIGLIGSRKTSKTVPKTKDMASKDIEPKNTTKFHVFKPHEVQVKDERQKMKINELLDIINKLVQEGKTNMEDVQRAADNLLINMKTLKDGPNPLDVEDIIRVYNEDIKNEVKRQNPEQTVETTTIGAEDLAKNTATTTGIKRFMISVLGTSESLVKRISQSLTRIGRMLINMGNMFRRPSD